MYTETLSPSFIGLTFAQAAEICFVRVCERIVFVCFPVCNRFQLKLLLMAIETRTEEGKPEIAIAPRGAKIRGNTTG